MESPTLYSAKICPYAHRIRLLLDEKSIEHTIKEINLKDIPEDFKHISPTNTVPCLVHQNQSLSESWVIAEYLEEAFSSTLFIPENPMEKAQMRFVISDLGENFFPAFFASMFEQEAAKKKKQIKLCIQQLKQINRKHQSEYLMGEQMTLADLTLYPFVERFNLFEALTDVSLRAHMSWLVAWEQRMLSRQSVQKERLSDDYYLQNF